MATQHAVSIEIVDHDTLAQRLASYRPEQVTVTGSTGSGYSRVSDLIGDDRYVGRLPVNWDTEVLVIRWEHLSEEAVRMLESLGVVDPLNTVMSLPIGSSLLLRRDTQL
jgi:hypothetical protein